MQKSNHVDVRTALNEVERSHRRIQSAGRWHAWIWLLIAVATPTFFIGTTAQSGDAAFGTALGFCALAAGLWWWESRQRRRVIQREAARIDGRVTWSYVGLVVVSSLFIMTVMPGDFSLRLVLVAVLPSVPCLYGAWMVMKQ